MADALGNPKAGATIMAGKKGMHTKVLNPAAVERIRERIQADRIIKKLENHILDSEEMSSSQVTAALGLLKKRVPDLSNVELSGNQDSPVAIAFGWMK